MGLGLWMMLANLFEPRKVAALEQIDTVRRTGSDAAHTAADKPGTD